MSPSCAYSGRPSNAGDSRAPHPDRLASRDRLAGRLPAVVAGAGDTRQLGSAGITRLHRRARQQHAPVGAGIDLARQARCLNTCCCARLLPQLSAGTIDAPAPRRLGTRGVWADRRAPARLRCANCAMVIPTRWWPHGRPPLATVTGHVRSSCDRQVKAAHGYPTAWWWPIRAEIYHRRVAAFRRQSSGAHPRERLDLIDTSPPPCSNTTRTQGDAFSLRTCFQRLLSADDAPLSRDRRNRSGIWSERPRSDARRPATAAPACCWRTCPATPTT